MTECAGRVRRYCWWVPDPEPQRSATDRHRQPGAVILITACDEIESWLLADEALCSWIGIRPQNCDTQPKRMCSGVWRRVVLMQ